MGAMKDQQIIISEIFDMAHYSESLLNDLVVLPEETKKELETHILAVGKILAPIVDNIDVLDD